MGNDPHQGHQQDGPHGHHRDLDQACQTAYRAAREAGLQPPFEVKIHLTGDNPFTGYLVKLAPTV